MVESEEIREGIGDFLLHLRQTLFHSPNSEKVRRSLTDKNTFEELRSSILGHNDAAINVIKDFARLHGLPREFQPVLCEPFHMSTISSQFKFKVALALKYAVQHDHDFLELKELHGLLRDTLPLDKINDFNNLDKYSRDTIAQLVLMIIAIMNADKLSSEDILDSDLTMLENYLPFINGKYKSEVRNFLEKMGCWSGSISQKKGGQLQRSNKILQGGQTVFEAMQNKRGFNVSAHVVKTQQTESMTVEEFASEKTQMANITHTNAVGSKDFRRQQEVRPPRASSSGSEQKWYRNTAYEIAYFHNKALGKSAISSEDIKYLCEKLEGDRWAFIQEDEDMVCKIAEIFYIVAGYQELEHDVILRLLQVVFDKTFKVQLARLFILHATRRFCNRLGYVLPNIKTIFSSREFGSVEVKSVITEILLNDTDDRNGENITISIKNLSQEQLCWPALNYIQRQISRVEIPVAVINGVSTQILLQVVLDSINRLPECKKTSRLLQPKTSLKIEQSMKLNKNLIAKATEVLEEYLDLNGATRLTPTELNQLLSVIQTNDARQSILPAVVKLVLKSMEKVINDTSYLNQFLESDLNTIFDFLFNISCSSGIEQNLKNIIFNRISNILESTNVRHYFKRINSKHIHSFLGEMRNDLHGFISANITKIILHLLAENPELVLEESVVNTISQIILSTEENIIKILCAEILFEMVKARKIEGDNATTGYVFGSVVLNRIQSLTFSKIADVRIYITSAYCTSLANQSKLRLPLEADHVNYLDNLYQSKKLVLNGTDFSEWINLNILLVFQEAIRQELEISEQVLQLTADILNNSFPESVDSNDYKIVVTVLEMMNLYSKQKAGYLPPAIVKAVECLFLQSDLLSTTCSEMLERYMLSGKCVSDAVVEEIARYLFQEPSTSITFLRMLGIANENQELLDEIYDRFQMELIATRLCAKEFAGAINSMGFRPSEIETQEDLFSAMAMYVSKGMLMTNTCLVAIKSLLNDWRNKSPQINDVLECLTMCSSNGQTLPMQIIELGLDTDNAAAYSVKLDFGMAVTRRSQQIPLRFLVYLCSRLEVMSGKISTEQEKKIVELVATMIQHDHHLPPAVVSAYCKCLAENKEIISVELILSVMRLIKNDIVSATNTTDFRVCKEIFLFACSSQNSIFQDLGTQALKTVPQEYFSSEELKILDRKDINDVEKLTEKSAVDNFMQLVNSAITDDTWCKEKCLPDLLTTLGNKIFSDVNFVQAIGTLLERRTGPLNNFEQVLVEMIFNSYLLTGGKGIGRNGEVRNACKTILQNLLTNKRKCIIPKSYLARLRQEDSEWASNLPLTDITVLSAISEFDQNPYSYEGIDNLLKVLQDPTVCEEYSAEIISLESIERLIIDGKGRIPPIVLHAYMLFLRRENTSPDLDECVQRVLDYFLSYHDNLFWNEKALIFKIFENAARIGNESVAEILSPTLHEHLLNVRTNALLLGECFTVMKVLHDRNILGELDLLWEATLENLALLYGDATINESPESILLLHTLLTVSTIDRNGLQKLPESEWTQHLMTTDMVIALNSMSDDELELHHEVKEFCQGISYPQQRLYVINAINDYMKQEKNLLSPARIIRCMNVNKTVSTGEVDILLYNTTAFVKKQILQGLASTLNNKLEKNVKTDSDVIIVMLDKATQDPSPITLKLLERLVDVVEMSKKTIYHFKELLQLIKENCTCNEPIYHHLTQRDGPIPISQLMVLAKLVYILEQIPAYGNPKTPAVANVESHLNYLFINGFELEGLTKVFQKMGSAIKFQELSHVSGLEIIENVLYQCVTYQITPKMFSYIHNVLLKKNTGDWIDNCNAVIMEHLHTGNGFNGTKSARSILEDFQKINEIEGPLEVSNFQFLISNIREGCFTTFLSGVTTQEQIRNWNKDDIKAWSSEVKTYHGLAESPDFWKEFLAVISRTCMLLRNYHLSSTQILSVYCAIQPNSTSRLLQVTTGSGKSTIIAAVAVFRALFGFPIDIYTSSPILAQRDANMWIPFYEMFGLTCDHNRDKCSGYIQGEKACYKKNIVYGETSQFQFDALRHEYSGLDTRTKREYGYALVDEVDAMLVDESSKLARLSSTFPGMDLLQLIYHLVWHRLHDIKNRIYAVGEGVYYLEGKRTVDEHGLLHYFYADEDGSEKQISKLAEFIVCQQNNPNALERAFIYKVDEVDDFIVSHLENYIKALIGDQHNFQKHIKKLPLSKPLQNFARLQVKNWVDSALTALTFSENVHYVVDEGQIKPVDYNSTGIIQSSTSWNNGLHQFLQIKHSLKVTSETITTNFLSNIAMFQKYEGRLVGLTGTLGSQHDQDLLRKVYMVETAVIPDLHYIHFHKLPPQVYSSHEEWLRSVTYSATHESSKKRAVLVICQTIKVAHLISENIKKILKSRKDRRIPELRVYTRNDQNQEKCVEQVIEGDIIVATNLAGRGTDINATQVEKHGGLHVILTFLPDSLRVEQQAFGRTARQGLKGTGQLIVLHKENINFDELKQLRDKQEKDRLQRFLENELPVIQLKDELFSKFCKAYSEMRSGLIKQVGKSLTPLEQTRLQAIEHEWAIFLKRIDEKDILLSGACQIYCEFDKKVKATCTDVDKSILTAENCFHLIQVGNEFYRRGNALKDNTSIAYEYFKKAIEVDGEFAPGAHAGLGFCLLRGKSHWVGQNSRQDGYQRKAIGHLKDALKILYDEISMHVTAQTLLQQRDGRTDSDLFNQLTERIGLLGEYCSNIQGIIYVVKRSLRAVYATEVLRYIPEKSRTWKLDDDNPSISSLNESRLYELEFHDLTRSNDVRANDQAISNLSKDDNNEIKVKNQNMKCLIECLGQTVNGIHRLQLDSVGTILEVKRILKAMDASAFILKVRNIPRVLLEKVMKSLNGRKIVAECRGLKYVHRRQITSLEDFTGFLADKSEVPMVEIFFVEEKTKSKVEISLRTAVDLKKLESLLLTEVDLRLDVILVGISKLKISQYWNVPGTLNEKMADNARQTELSGLLPAYYRNTSSFKRLPKQKAVEIITLLRQNGIPFILRLNSMNHSKANDALKNSDRRREDINEKALREMGYQFSSSYVPIDIIVDLQQRGIVLMPNFKENACIPWKSVVTMGIIASVQVAAGGVLICSGFGSTLGMSLVTEGMSDLVNSQKAYSSRMFSWTDYLIQKSVSLTVSCVSIGMSSLRDAVKGAKTLSQGVVTEAVEQAGTRIITNQGKNLNQGIKLAEAKLKETAGKYIATKAGESVARTGINAIVNSLHHFTFDFVKSYILHEVEINVKQQFHLPNFVDALSTNIATNISESYFDEKVLGWINEVTNPKSNNWNKAWETVALPLCQGILSDPTHAGSTFSMAICAWGIIKGSREIGTVIKCVCEHIRNRLEAENKLFTTEYFIETEFGLKEQALEIAKMMTFGNKSKFHVSRYPEESDLNKYKIKLTKLKSLFDTMHKCRTQFKAERDPRTSRIIALVANQLTSHIIGVANRQLAQPLTGYAVGKLVNELSRQLQNYSVIYKRELLEDKNHGDNVKFEDQIQEHSKNYMIQFDQRAIIGLLTTMPTVYKRKPVIPNSLTGEQVETAKRILEGGPADLTVVFILARIYNKRVKIVFNINYTPTEDDKSNITKIIVWESGERNHKIGHYMLMDPSTGDVTDLDSGDCNCLYNVFSEITEESVDDLRMEVAMFMATNDEVFMEINQFAKWIENRYPEEAAALLLYGGVRHSTNTRVITVRRRGVDGVPLIHEVRICKGNSEGSTPEEGERKEQIKLINSINPIKKIVGKKTRNVRELSFEYLEHIETILFTTMVAGHTINAKFGTKGTSCNTVLMENQANLKVFWHFERRIRNFLEWIQKEEAEGRKCIDGEDGEYCRISFRAGKTGFILHQNDRIPFSKDLSFFAYIDPLKILPGKWDDVLTKFKEFCTKPVGKDKKHIMYLTRYQSFTNAFGIRFTNTIIPEVHDPEVDELDSSDQESIHSS